MLHLIGFPLPHDWRESILRLAQEHGRHVLVRGRGPGSLEPEETAGLDYRVVSGEAIEGSGSWLNSFYVDMIPLLRDRLDCWILPRVNVAGRINMNTLSGPGGRYEWHTDQNSHTVILFLDTLGDGDGGELAIRPEGGPEMLYRPVEGEIVAFAGGTIPHAVMPLRRRITRTTLLLSYTTDEHVDEPASAYLYEGASRQAP
jgi:hypothetical protein